jgi:hypothetical protein
VCSGIVLWTIDGISEEWMKNEPSVAGRLIAAGKKKKLIGGRELCGEIGGSMAERKGIYICTRPTWTSD